MTCRPAASQQKPSFSPEEKHAGSSVPQRGTKLWSRILCPVSIAGRHFSAASTVIDTSYDTQGSSRSSAMSAPSPSLASQ
jgi:hypothetical protein